ncbi:DUF1801 domain-containing protein [Nostoc ellipsosporum NOK]|jgi:hypothetical protein|nr:DUF1801 domain-containing protein [Nostoc ellipsosporum NOK]
MKEVDAYIAALPVERQEAMTQLRNVISNNLPAGFQEVIAYKMPAWVVPHSYYPAGYHCDPKQPLPFISIASQKNFIALYHMGMYAVPELYQWFTEAYPNFSKTKLDMGKSCVRFKKPESIPFELIGQLMKKMTPDQWIKVYETNFRR